MLPAQFLINRFECGFVDEEVASLVVRVAAFAGRLAAGQIQRPCPGLSFFGGGFRGDGASLFDEERTVSGSGTVCCCGFGRMAIIYPAAFMVFSEVMFVFRQRR